MKIHVGCKVAVSGGGEAEVIDKLGEGGQGTVWRVSFKGEEYALKWYFTYKLIDTTAFKDNLIHNIDKGAPKDAGELFLWPLYLVESQEDDGFGYLMQVRSSGFYEFSDILLNRLSKTMGYLERIFAAINITKAFRSLYNGGYCYQDLNDGNLFVNPENGQVLVCDNDNVAEVGFNSGIAGKPGYMAPEILIGQAKPGPATDKFSLAVILFKLLCIYDPLKGEKVYKSICLTAAAERKHYGEEPVFILDRKDDSNRPVAGVNDSVLKLWNAYPTILHNLFYQAFEKGMSSPNHRVEYIDWIKCLIVLRDQWVECSCGKTGFFDRVSKIDSSFSCNKCGFSYPKLLAIDSKLSKLLLLPKTKIYSLHFTGSYSNDINALYGEVIVNPKNPNKWGIRNLSSMSWTSTDTDGTIKEIPAGKVVGLVLNREVQCAGNKIIFTEN